jgi:D-lactate dehydrogenase (cytochrome)
MGKILTLHKEDMDVVVQPAVGWEMLNEELAKDNLFFPPDPGPGAMIGGMVGTGCSGTNSYRYGTMREWVLSLTSCPCRWNDYQDETETEEEQCWI